MIFPGGDNVIYALEAESGKMVWKFNCTPGKRAVGKDGIKAPINLLIGTPVVQNDRLFIAMGIYPDHGNPTRDSYVLCLDLTKTGDVSPVSMDAKTPENQKSALVWAYGGKIQPRPKKGREEAFGPTMSTPAIHDGLLYISEMGGFLDCLDAKTGQRYWEYDLRATVWGSPLLCGR